jgi:bifunctional DNA-binding transcriptional regulator/antitoxin component of YhaV-PrlF toxin-antitoxin module
MVPPDWLKFPPNNPMKNYKFKAKIQEGSGGGAYVVFPHDVEKEFGTKGAVPVKTTLDGEPYVGSIMRMGLPHHILGVPKAIREKLGKGPGSVIEVVLSKDEAVRTIEIPPEFKKRMEKEKLLAFFEGLSFTNRKEYVRWIMEAKKQETRKARFEKAVELLKKGTKTPV